MNRVGEVVATGTALSGCLLFLNDYFEGADYSPGRTDNLTLQAPAAVLSLDDGNNIINHYQGSAGAYDEA